MKYTFPYALKTMFKDVDNMFSNPKNVENFRHKNYTIPL